MTKMTNMACLATKLPLFKRPKSAILGWLYGRFGTSGNRIPLADQGFELMRKIVLAAAIAGSALGLAACSEAADEAADAADAMAADAEAVAEEATAEAGEAMEAAGDAVEGAAEEAADAVEGAVEEVTEAAEEAAE